MSSTRPSAKWPQRLGRAELAGCCEVANPSHPPRHWARVAHSVRQSSPRVVGRPCRADDRELTKLAAIARRPNAGQQQADASEPQPEGEMPPNQCGLTSEQFGQLPYAGG